MIGHVVKKAVQKGDAVVAPLAPLDLPKKHPFVNCASCGKAGSSERERRARLRANRIRTDLVKPRPEPYWR